MAAFSIRRPELYLSRPEPPGLGACLTLTVAAGDFLVLCGPSGCGKSTLLRQLKTVLAPHGTGRGRILLPGRRRWMRWTSGPRRARIGFVQQAPDNQIVTDKVWHELAFGLESLGCDTPDHPPPGGGDGRLLRHPGLVPPGGGRAVRRTEAAAEPGLGHGHAARTC